MSVSTGSNFPCSRANVSSHSAKTGPARPGRVLPMMMLNWCFMAGSLVRWYLLVTVTTAERPGGQGGTPKGSGHDRMNGRLLRAAPCLLFRHMDARIASHYIVGSSGALHGHSARPLCSPRAEA